MTRGRSLLMAVLTTLVFFAVPHSASAQSDGCGLSAEYMAPCNRDMDNGGYSGGGGYVCQRCVVGDWNANGQQSPQCKNRDVYTSQWPEYSPCSVVTRCWSDPGQGTYCEVGCAGSPCYSV
jgi:hypothetical protein